MVLDERIQIHSTRCCGLGRELLCETGRSVFLWRNHTRKRIDRKSLQKKASEWWATLVYMLLVSRQVPVSQQYWPKSARIGPSLADRLRVELALFRRERSNRRCINSYRNKRREAHRVALPASARIDRAGEGDGCLSGWKSRSWKPKSW